MIFKPFANPIMVVSDNPSLPGGLARSGRDIAMLLCTLPEFRVGYLGRGLGNRRKFPFTLYDYPESGAWGQDYIQQAWEDFSDGECGIIFSLDDPSRRLWWSHPHGLPEELQRFLGAGRNFQKWGYFPLDSAGPGGRDLGYLNRQSIAGFDRALAASEWGAGLIDSDWLPHGIHPENFHLIPGARGYLGWREEDVWVGCVMANQERKDWGVAFECFRHLQRHYGNRFHAWVHTDTPLRHWDLYSLVADYGVEVDATFSLHDTQLALHYAASDVTILPTGGEGFGFPIVESMASGTAAVTTDYAAGPAFTEPECRVEPVTYRVSTPVNALRAVLDGRMFAEAAVRQIEWKKEGGEIRAAQIAARVEHLAWPNLRHLWERWLKEGLADGSDRSCQPLMRGAGVPGSGDQGGRDLSPTRQQGQPGQPVRSLPGGLPAAGMREAAGDPGICA